MKPKVLRTLAAALVCMSMLSAHAQERGIITSFDHAALLDIPVFYSGAGLFNCATTDSTWYREPIEESPDMFRMFEPVIPEVLLPPQPEKRSLEDKSRPPKKGEHYVMYDPFKDESKSIFTSNYTRFGDGGTIFTATDRKEAIAIELVGIADGCPIDIADDVRNSIATGVAGGTCHFVLDAQVVAGGDYDGSVVAYGGSSSGFHHTSRMEELYCKGIRYVVSGALVNYCSHRYLAYPSASSYTYETMMTVVLSAYDLDTRQLLEVRWLNVTGNGRSIGDADTNALRSLRDETRYLTRRDFKITTRIIALGEPDKKGKIKYCRIGSGNEMGVTKTDLFAIFPANNPNSSLVGRVKVTAAGDGFSDCIFTKGANKVVPLIQEGTEFILLSDGQALF